LCRYIYIEQRKRKERKSARERRGGETEEERCIYVGERRDYIVKTITKSIYNAILHISINTKYNNGYLEYLEYSYFNHKEISLLSLPTI